MHCHLVDTSIQTSSATSLPCHVHPASSPTLDILVVILTISINVCRCVRAHSNTGPTLTSSQKLRLLKTFIQTIARLQPGGQRSIAADNTTMLAHCTNSCYTARHHYKRDISGTSEPRIFCASAGCAAAYHNCRAVVYLDLRCTGHKLPVDRQRPVFRVGHPKVANQYLHHPKNSEQHDRLTDRIVAVVRATLTAPLQEMMLHIADSLPPQACIKEHHSGCTKQRSKRCQKQSVCDQPIRRRVEGDSQGHFKQRQGNSGFG